MVESADEGRDYIAKVRQEESQCYGNAQTLKEEFVLYATLQGKHQAQPVTAPAHTSLVESRQQAMETVKEARSGDTIAEHRSVRRCCPFSSPVARPWSLRAQSSKQKEAREAKAAWLTTLPAAAAVGLGVWAADPCGRARRAGCFER